jgi:hypothetical protein
VKERLARAVVVIFVQFAKVLIVAVIVIAPGMEIKVEEDEVEDAVPKLDLSLLSELPRWEYEEDNPGAYCPLPSQREAPQL